MNTFLTAFDHIPDARLLGAGQTVTLTGITGCLGLHCLVAPCS